MFFAICKTTIKNLLRSKTFWLVIAVMVIFVGYEIATVTHQIYNMELGQVIDQNHPMFVFEYQSYLQKCNGLVANLLQYPVPILTVVAAALILKRDYGDKFFEIEKGAGVPAWKYLSARLLAVISLCMFVTVVLCFVYFHGQVVPMLDSFEMTPWAYVCDSTVRLTRQILVLATPCIVFYTCLTYFVGTLCQSSVGAAVCSLALAIGSYVYDLFYIYNNGIFMEYLRPSCPLKLMYYMYYYDSEWFAWMIDTFDTSLWKAMLCYAFLIGCAVLCSVLSSRRIKKRIE